MLQVGFKVGDLRGQLCYLLFCVMKSALDFPDRRNLFAVDKGKSFCELGGRIPDALGKANFSGALGKLTNDRA